MPRVIIETDAGGDPDDEQSLVRLLVYANDLDIEGIIANRPVARDRENKNSIRDGLGILRAQVNAYGQCYANLVQHDPRFPKPEPPFPLWVDTFRPPLDGKRWYHRFSALNATADGFDIERDVRTGHGPLGALYPTNTGLRQKEGDTMAFLYLLPTGMNDPSEPTWGSWAGRYGPNEEHPGKPYFWANQKDAWRGTTSRDNTSARWAADLQSDFRARMDWCVKRRAEANHRPNAVLNGRSGGEVLRLDAKPGSVVELDAQGSSDPDGEAITCEWFVYGEAGTYRREILLSAANGPTTRFTAPQVKQTETTHAILRVKDNGEPSLCAYRRAVVTLRP